MPEILKSSLNPARYRLTKSVQLLTLIWFSSTAITRATIYTVDATLQGWYTSSGIATRASPYQYPYQNYAAGLSAGIFYRDFFVFDLSGLPSGTISSATLSVYNPSKSNGDLGDGFKSSNPSENFQVGSVSTLVSTLAVGAGGVGVFNDFAAGTLWGTRLVSSSDNGTFVQVGLNASFNQAADLDLGTSTIVLAGHLAGDITFTRDAEIFGFTGTSGSPIPQLSLNIVPVPEPAPMVLGALAGIVYWLGQRTARRQLGLSGVAT
jgi:hypothetical protein